MSQLAIDVSGLTRIFGDYRAVDNLNLQVPVGCIYGFLGPNGCGKSTTIRMLTGLLTPSSGQIKVLGLDLPRDAEQLKSRVGYMTQKFSLYDSLTVYENLEFVGQIYGLRSIHRRERIRELLKVYHLENKRNIMAGALSGGQKQRMSLAAATIHKPDLLFLDEPTSAVDPENRRDFWEKLFDLSDQGTTILVSTHYMDEAERCHQLAILELGQKRNDGNPSEMIGKLIGRILEIRGDNLRFVKRELEKKDIILSVSQVGQSLRVLLRKPIMHISEFQSEFQNYVTVEMVRPSLEDVFVASTGRAYELSN